MLKIIDFDYTLPLELIANTPMDNRDESRLLVLENQNILDLYFKQITDFIKPNDLLILNNSLVLNARLFGQKSTGGKIELLIERILPNNNIIAHIRSNKQISLQMVINLDNNFSATVIKKLDGLFELSSNVLNWFTYLEQFGHTPLPPYIKRNDTLIDKTRYQTIYAKLPGSVAAPTAGLHFTKELLSCIENQGTQIGYVTLHVGSGTFKPINTMFVHQHKMHSEVYTIPQETVNLIHQCKAKGGRIIAVGSTSLRTLETYAKSNYTCTHGETDIFITPGFEFKLVDKLITNFHLPKSTLLMLVSAFSGSDNIKMAYTHAIKNRYRFFSYGDAMLLTRKTAL